MHLHTNPSFTHPFRASASRAPLPPWTRSAPRRRFSIARSETMAARAPMSAWRSFVSFVLASALGATFAVLIDDARFPPAHRRTSRSEGGAASTVMQAAYFSLAHTRWAANVTDSLLVLGMDPNARDRRGQTALGVSVLNGRPDVASVLLCHGADPDRTDSRGNTALHWAADEGDTKMLRTLLDHGANANAADCQLRTPLHNAAQSGKLRAIELLLARGARADAVDARGCRARDLAFGARSKEALECCQDHLEEAAVGLVVTLWAAGVCAATLSLVLPRLP